MPETTTGQLDEGLAPLAPFRRSRRARFARRAVERAIMERTVPSGRSSRITLLGPRLEEARAAILGELVAEGPHADAEHARRVAAIVVRPLEGREDELALHLVDRAAGEPRHRRRRRGPLRLVVDLQLVA